MKFDWLSNLAKTEDLKPLNILCQFGKDPMETV